jgi:predicted transcriptional regulator of viral defense system
MTKLSPQNLLKAIPREEFDYTLLTGTLSEYSGVRQKINELLRNQVIIRVKKGLYVFGPEYNRNPVCIEVLANLIYGPSCLSLEYALAYYGLIPERVEQITSVTSKRDRIFKTPLGRFSYRHLGDDRYPHGIEQVWIDNDHPILIASPEKALLDYLVLYRVSGITGSEEAEKFLESDLRIDRANWKQFDPNTLRQLNRYYRHKGAEFVVDIL